MAEPEAKGPLEKPIDWFAGWKASFQRVRQRLGLSLTVLLTLAVAGSFVWWNWNEIAKRPGIDWVIDVAKRRPIPLAPAGRLTIAVAQLEGDKDREQEKQLLAGLEEFEGVETLAIGRMVEWPASGTERANRQQAEEEARGLLARSGADVLIWGRVIRSGMRLYWTAPLDISGAKTSGTYQATIALPDAFWDDLKQIIGLLSQTRLADLTDDPGHYIADKLRPLVGQVRALAQSKEGTWNPETLAGVRFALASALYHVGEQSRTNEPLEESVALHRKVLDQWTRERAPSLWALTQNRLGIALSRLGEQSDTRATGLPRFQAALDAYRESLKEYTRESSPRDWAGVQVNLGNVLSSLGQRERDREKLEDAAKAYREALQELSRDREPSMWAMAETNLGDALETLGDVESDPARLKEAVAAYGEALKVYDRERAPLDWARTKFNLGKALRALGEQEKSTERLAQAVSAYRESLSERTRERSPEGWAITQNGLANTLLSLGERENGTAHLRQAVDAYRELLKVWTRERYPFGWSETQDRLGNALLMLGERESGTAELEGAVAAFNETLRERTRERIPSLWAVSTGRQGVALMRLAERRGDAEMARQALKQIEAAFTTLRDAGTAASTAEYFEEQLPNARAVAEKLAKR
jgi:tetratricopeptide (TPR) repeat protein